MSLVIPIFIAHRGCPHQCLFCNQHAIAGQESSWPDVTQEITSWLSHSKQQEDIEVAFYGGSFTCLPRDEQSELLEQVQPFIASGIVKSIRLSTRPDCVTREACMMLKGFGVTMVELGVQSLDDEVLHLARRGHTSSESRNAMALLRQAGLAVGVQLLPGLPGETTCSFLSGVKEVAAFRPELVRIYPALIVAGSDLAELYERGEYIPLTLNKAIGLTRRAREIFLSAKVPVARMGLQPSDRLNSQVVAGPYHPAFGELVVSRQWYREILHHLAACSGSERLDVHISDRDLSAVIGMKKMNIERLHSLGLSERFTIVPEKQRDRGTVKYVVS